MDLSVVIPAHNAQGTVAACLRSVTRCPKDSFEMECLVVDGGSADDTAAIVKRYIQRDSRIRLVMDENGGLPGARNRGIREAQGDFIFFLDACDRLCEDAWENIEALVVDECADFTAFSHIIMRADGKMKAAMLPIRGVLSDDCDTAARLMYAGSSFNDCRGKIFRSDIIRDNNIAFRMDLPFGEEYFFVADYFACCESFVMTKAVIVYHIERDGSSGESFDMKERLGLVRVAYEYVLEAARQYGGAGLVGMVCAYYLKVLAALFCEAAMFYGSDREAFYSACGQALGEEITAKILGGVNVKDVKPILKKYEYYLLRNGSLKRIAGYFLLAGKMRRVF